MTDHKTSALDAIGFIDPATDVSHNPSIQAALGQVHAILHLADVISKADDNAQASRKARLEAATTQYLASVETGRLNSTRRRENR